MPIYEYVPTIPVCGMCPDRFAVLQGASDAPLEACPFCGMDVRRVVSSSAFRVEKGVDAASRGFTTFKRSEAGVWEKIAGEGADVLEASPEDRAAVAAEKSVPKVLTLP